MSVFPVCRFPEEAGVSSKGILQFLQRAEEEKIGYHAVMVLRHGKLAATLRFAPYEEKTPHMLFSLSKTFCSAAAGFAVSEGLLSWDSRVAEVLPECVPENPSEDLKKITLSHLLCMGSGLHPESDSFEGGVENWAKKTLSYPVIHEPGTHFHYNSHGTYLVSRMVQKVAGVNIRDYLKPRLFDKLGIETPHWDTCPQGVCTGGWGLKLSVESLAKFGQLLLQDGIWQGQRVLPEGWVENASSVHIDNSNGHPKPDSDWHQGYGYQIWRCCHGRFRGDGMYGQYCVVDPQREMVVVCTAGSNDIARELKILHECLFDAADMPEGTEEEKHLLQEKIAQLAYPLPQGAGERILNGTLTQEGGAVELQFAQQEAGGELHLTVRCMTLPGQDESVELHFAQGRYQVNPPIRLDAQTAPVTMMCAYGWQGNQLSLAARTLDGPMTLDVTLRFEKDGVIASGNSAAFPLQGASVRMQGTL